MEGVGAMVEGVGAMEEGAMETAVAMVTQVVVGGMADKVRVGEGATDLEASEAARPACCSLLLLST